MKVAVTFDRSFRPDDHELLSLLVDEWRGGKDDLYKGMFKEGPEIAVRII